MSAHSENGGGMGGRAPAGDEEAHLAALLAVLSVRAGEVPGGTPLQRWRSRRLAALAASTPTPDRPAGRR